MQLPWHLYVMAAVYALAGLNHFRVPKLYLRIMPRYLPAHKTLNYLSGAAEVLLAVALCVPSTSSLGAWGIIGLLVAVFPANLYMLTDPKAAMGLPRWALWLRLPLQALLIAWAWLYT